MFSPVDPNVSCCNVSQSLLFPSSSAPQQLFTYGFHSRRSDCQSLPITLTGNTFWNLCCPYCSPSDSLPVTFHLEKQLKAVSLKSDLLLLKKKRNKGFLSLRGKHCKTLKKKKSHAKTEEWWNVTKDMQETHSIERHTLATSVHPVVSTVKRTSCDQQKAASNGCDYMEKSQNTD